MIDTLLTYGISTIICILGLVGFTVSVNLYKQYNSALPSTVIAILSMYCLVCALFIIKPELL